MGFLIPTARPNPGLLTRLGRLLHWTALGIAALTVLLPAYFAATQSASTSVQPAPTRVGQVNPFDRLDEPRRDDASAPWANDPIVAQAPPAGHGYAVISPNQPTTGARAAPARDTSGRAADPWAAFDGVPPAWAQAPVISAPLSTHQQGLPYEVWLFFAAVFAMAGRAARYLFAGE